MAGSLSVTNAILAKRVQALEEKLDALSGKFNELSALFAWYYLDDTRRDFAIILRMHEDNTADLLCVGGHVSGKTHMRTHKRLVLENWPKTGRFEPIIYPDLGPAMAEFLKAEDRIDDSETEKEAEDAPAKSALTPRPGR